LVKLALEQLLEVLGLNAWGMGSMPQDATSLMEKDEDLQEMIRSTRCVYAQQLRMTWDVKNWDRESSKASRTKLWIDILNFHESRMIHGR
jgi:L-rhamnose isomerase